MIIINQLKVYLDQLWSWSCEMDCCTFEKDSKQLIHQRNTGLLAAICHHIALKAMNISPVSFFFALLLSIDGNSNDQSQGHIICVCNMQTTSRAVMSSFFFHYGSEQKPYIDQCTYRFTLFLIEILSYVLQTKKSNCPS